MRRAARPVGNGKTRLLVIRIGVAHRNDQARLACCFDAWSRAQHFRSNGNQPRLSFGSLKETVEQIL